MATPNGDAATAWFEWGTTVGYGRTTSPVAVGAGSKVVRVSVGITELIPRQVHHCRLVVSNVAGVAFGSDQPFIVGGDVVAWGDNSSGQTEVPGALRTAVAVAAGAAHSLALRNDGTLVGWGANFDGQATVPAGLNDLVAIAGGRLHSLALRRDGTVVAWGWNVSGQTDVPAGISNAVAIAAGGYHSLALRSDGTVVGWGATTVPAGLSNVVAVAASENHSLALRAGGTVVAWGANDFGATNVPVGLRQVVAIAAGEYLSLALRSDGTVVAWGYNLYGQATVPAGLSNVAAIAGGGFHSLALRGDGLVVAWGDNRAGQTTVPSSLSNVAALVGGYSHGLALRPNAAPLAIAQTFYGTANSDLVLTLSGSDLDGERLSYRITALPGAGTLYQYIGGARGLAITAPNTEVSDGAGQVIFAPAPDGFGDPYASFSFVANDTVADSPPAVVTLRIRSQLIMNHIVSNTNDGGAGSLRAAVLDALPGDTISFSITGTITLSNGELFVARDLAIMGPGVTNLTISGKGASRVFEIGSTVTASISDLTISDGVAQGAAGTNNVSGPGGDGEPGLGGGILNRGSLTLANCALTFNRAFGGPAGSGYPSGGGGKAEGGGIFNGGSLTIRNSTFLGNGVVGGPGAGAPASWSGVGGNGSGGAVCNTNILIVLQSTFSSNSVTGGNGFARGFFTSGDGGAGGSADGGAICNRRTTALLLSSFFGNLAQGGAGGSGGPGQGHSTGGGPGGHGGVGGFGRGGAITSDSGTVTMTNTTFAANRAQGGPGGAGGEGGATGCFTGSYPGQGGNGGRGGDGTGGGIYHSGTSLRLFSITCSSNTASGGLGGVGGLGGTTPGLGCNPPKPPRGWSGSYGTAGEGWAGGLHTPIGSTTMQNTILAANTASLTSLDLAGTVTSQGFNLIGVTNDSSGWIASDLKGNFAAPLDPKLGPLQDNGGPTFAMALLPGSPAIDHGSSNGLTTDQRGRFRPLDDPAIPNATSGDGSDIGAFELQSPAPVLTELVRNGSDVLLSFLTEVGQHYRVERTDVLAPATWSIVADNLPGSGSILRVVDHGGAVQPLRFYRGRTLP